MSLAFAESGGLSFDVLQGSEHSLYKSSVLISGKRESVLFDGMFTQSEGHQAVEVIRRSGKRLKAVLVSHSGPDYYFSLEPIVAAFPDAQVLATPAVVAAIKHSVDQKMSAWAAKLGSEAPAVPVIPEVLRSATFLLEGHKIDLVTPVSELLANRTFGWIPSAAAILGGVLLYGGVHLWTADTSFEARRAWLAAVTEIKSRAPAVAIPGHGIPGSSVGLAAIEYTAAYLKNFEHELAQVTDASSVIDAMNRLYPTSGLQTALEIGAKVGKNELKWGAGGATSWSV